MAAPLFAVTPLVLAPVVVLAMLFPTLFAGPLRGLRRWWVVFNVCTISGALYTARFTFQGVNRRLAEINAWWSSPLAFWLALALVAAVGAIWVWWRQRAANPAGLKPGSVELVALGLLSLASLAVVGYSLWDSGPRWQPALLIGPVPLVAWGYACYLHWNGRRQSRLHPLLPTQGVMLITLAVAYVVIGVAMLHGAGEGL